MTKQKWAANENSIGNAIGFDGATGQIARPLSNEESIRILASIDEMTKRGVVNLDPNAGNFLAKTEGGITKISCTEGGSVVKVGDPQKAREVMKKMIAENIEGDPMFQRIMIQDEMTKIGGANFAEQMDKAMDIGGFTFKNNNVGSLINKDILKIWEDPKKWEEFMKNYNRSTVLNHPSNIIKDANELSKFNQLQQAQKSVQQSLINASEEVARKAPVIEKQIIEAGVPGPEDLKLPEMPNMQVPQSADDIYNYFKDLFSLKRNHNYDLWESVLHCVA
jgi:hypothetical protein